MPEVAKVVAVLTARRIELGLSQRRVGFLSGLGTSVCEYEAGRHAPTLPKLEAWADAVGCDIAVMVRPAPPTRTRSRNSTWARRVAASAEPDDLDEIRRRLVEYQAGKEQS